MIKVAIDSNVLFSAFVNQGAVARKLLVLAGEQRIYLGVPKYCLLELEPVFRDKLGQDWDRRYRQLQDWVDTYAEEIIYPRGKMLNRYKDYVVGDVFDVPVIASAIEWGAEYFVTGNFKDYRKEKVELHLKMISVRQFLNIFQAEEGADY